jgi:hypothetical protein
MGIYDDLLAAPSTESEQPKRPTTTGNVYSDMLAAPPPEPAAPPTSWGDTANDFGRAVTNAATFGMGNRIKGYLSGTGTDEQAKRSEAARARSPVASIAGDIYGSLAIPGFGAEAAAARMGGGLLARGAAYGATGAATGAAQGAGNTYTGELPDYIKNAAIGSALGGALGSAGGAIFGHRPAVTRAETPTIPELYADKTARYNLLNSNPAQYDAQHLAQAARDLENRFATSAASRFHQRDSPSTWDALSEMQQPYAAAVRAGPSAISTVDPGNLEFIRQGINKIPQSAERSTDRASGRIVKQALRDFTENPPMGAVMPGSEAAARLASEQSVLANAANAGYKRAQIANALQHNAQNTAASNYSGLNLENYLRQGYRGLLSIDRKTGLNDAQRAGFNADEIGRMQNFVEGVDTPGRNALRWVAKTAGGGSGLGFLAASAIGGGIGSYALDDPRWLGAAGLPLAGLAARSAGNRIAMRNIQQLNETLAQRNPLYAERLATSGTMPGPGMPGTAKAARDAIALEILRSRSQQPPE